MASGGARRGRRDNGLVAAEYAAAADVDPRVGEHLLDVLGLRGIAAYLQPTADLHPITRTTTLPTRPTDRLYVDRTHLDTARAFIRQLTEAETEAPEPAAAETPTSNPAEPSIDDMFAAIVAGYDREADVAWPDSENLPPARGSESSRRVSADELDLDTDDQTGGNRPTDTARTLRRWQDSTIRPDGWRSPTDDRGLLDGLDGLDSDGFGDGFDGEDEEGYTPPPPPPLPRVAPATIAAVIAIIAGVVIFFNPTLLPIDQTVAMVFGFCGILGGFVALIWRLRPGDDDDDHFDPNDGAVV